MGNITHTVQFHKDLKHNINMDVPPEEDVLPETSSSGQNEPITHFDASAAVRKQPAFPHSYKQPSP